MSLFSRIVQPTRFYGRATRTRDEEIRRVREKMWVSVVAVRRKTTFVADGQIVLREWIPWIRRETRQAESINNLFTVPDGVEEVAWRRIRWARHVARRCDGQWAEVML